jgi:hypothetical protein
LTQLNLYYTLFKGTRAYNFFINNRLSNIDILFTLKSLKFNDDNYLYFISVDSKMPASVPTATVFPRATFPKLLAIDNRKVSRYSFSKQSYQSSDRSRDSRYRYRLTPACMLHSF